MLLKPACVGSGGGGGLSRIWALVWRDELVLRVSRGDLRRNSLVENVII